MSPINEHEIVDASVKVADMIERFQVMETYIKHLQRDLIGLQCKLEEMYINNA